MNNWLTKLAGVTFDIQDAMKIAQPESVFNLTWALKTWAASHAPRHFADQIDVDGLEETFTGTINWYVDAKDPSINDIPMYANQFIREELLPKGIQAHVRGLEKSNSRSQMVWRIDITRNDTEHLQQIPSVQISQWKAESLLNMMGMKDQYAGSMSVSDFANRIQQIKQRSSLNTNSPRMNRLVQDMEFGQENPVTDDQIYDVIDRLEQLLSFARQHGFKEISWA